jgi:hypothetical protein
MTSSEPRPLAAVVAAAVVAAAVVAVVARTEGDHQTQP